MAILFLTMAFAEGTSIALLTNNLNALNPVAAATSRQSLARQLNAASTVFRRYWAGVGWNQHDNTTAESLSQHIRTAINDLRQYY